MRQLVKYLFNQQKRLLTETDPTCLTERLALRQQPLRINHRTTLCGTLKAYNINVLLLKIASLELESSEELLMQGRTREISILVYSIWKKYLNYVQTESTKGKRSCELRFC